MLHKESVSVRPNWQTRISNKGLDPKQWSEGSMLVIRENPAELTTALTEYSERVRNALNDLFSNADPRKTPSFGHMRPEQVFNAAASSWAHQDPSFPIRLDIGVKKGGGFVLIAAKGDYLEGMIAAASASKSWHLHHFEGMTEMLEINYLTEHLTQELQPFGKHASPPSIKDVTILSSEKVCSAYLANCIGESSGLKLSKVGVGSLEDISNVDSVDQSQLSRSIIKIDPWSKILSEAEANSPWFDLFDTPRAFTFQPPWIWALDELIDLSEDFDQDQVEVVLNIWLTISSYSPVPLIVSSEYKEGYKFEYSTITPVVLNIQSPSEEGKAKPE